MKDKNHRHRPTPVENRNALINNVGGAFSQMTDHPTDFPPTFIKMEARFFSSRKKSWSSTVLTMQTGLGPLPWSSMAKSEVGEVGVVAAEAAEAREDVSSKLRPFEESGRLEEDWRKENRREKKNNENLKKGEKIKKGNHERCLTVQQWIFNCFLRYKYLQSWDLSRPVLCFISFNVLESFLGPTKNQ